MTDAQIFTAIQKALEGVPPERTGSVLQKVAKETGQKYTRVSQVWLDAQWGCGG